MNRTRTWKYRSISLAAAGIAAASIAAAEPAPPQSPGQDLPPDARPEGHDDRPSQQLSGIVLGFNHGPQGEVEGVILKAGDKLVQLNMPRESAQPVTLAVHIGDSVHAEATEARNTTDHDVCDLISITPSDGKAVNIQRREPWQAKHVEGTVKCLNYDRRGEVSGAVLETGDFIHLEPQGPEKVDVKVGQSLSVDGYARHMDDGHDAIDADTVNGTRIKPDGPPKPPPHPGERPAPDRRDDGGPRPDHP